MSIYSCRAYTIPDMEKKKIEIPFLFKEKGNNIQLTRSTLWKLNFSVATFWCRDFTNFARACFSLKFFYNFVKSATVRMYGANLY